MVLDRFKKWDVKKRKVGCNGKSFRPQMLCLYVTLDVSFHLPSRGYTSEREGTVYFPCRADVSTGYVMCPREVLRVWCRAQRECPVNGSDQYLCHLHSGVFWRLTAFILQESSLKFSWLQGITF